MVVAACVCHTCDQAKHSRWVLQRVRLKARLFAAASLGSTDLLSAILRRSPEAVSLHLPCVPVGRMGLRAGEPAGECVAGVARDASAPVPVAWTTAVHLAAWSGSVSATARILRVR